MTARWWTGRALGLDFESDGRDPAEARIISYAATYVRPNMQGPGGIFPTTHTSLVKPEREIDPGAVAVHGISTEHAQAEGMDREKAVRHVVSLIEEFTGTDDAGVESPLIGHNVGSYDLTLLDREMRRLGVGSLGLSDGFGAIGMVTLRVDGRTTAAFHVIDTYVLDKMLDRFRPGKRQLTFAADYYGVPMADGAAHEAQADVLASMRIAWRIAQRCAMAAGMGPNGYDMDAVADFLLLHAGRRDPNELGRTFAAAAQLTVAELHAKQVTAAAEQAEGLRAHFIKQGKTEDAATVSGAWPFRPYV